MEMNRRAILAGMAAATTVTLSDAEAQPATPPPPAIATAFGPFRIPARNSQAPLKPRIDYEALRQKRMAEVDEETRLICQPMDQPPTGFTPAPRPNPNVMAPGFRAFNLDVPGPAGTIPMRIWMPEKHDKPIGLYLHTHGGGWAAGAGPGSDTEACSYAVDWGCAVAQPDYRVSWKAKFPAAVDDCWAAYRYILEHGSSLGIDTTKIGIGGGCAGANIATVVSLMARDAGIQKPAIQWLWSGVFDTRNNTGSYDEFANYYLPRDIAEAVTRLYLRDREDTYDWRSSPLLAPTLKGLSPALVWCGEWELLKDEAHQYASRMRDAGVEVTLIEGPQQPHGGIYAFNPKTGQRTRYSQETLPKIAEIMRRHIGPA